MKIRIKKDLRYDSVPGIILASFVLLMVCFDVLLFKNTRNITVRACPGILPPTRGEKGMEAPDHKHHENDDPWTKKRNCGQLSTFTCSIRYDLASYIIYHIISYIIPYI